MEPRIDRAAAELRTALKGLQPSESFDIIAFYGKTRVFRKQLVPANSQSLKDANKFLNSLFLDTGTNLEKALKAAFAIRGVNVVVVMTDGVPTYGERDFTKLAARVRQMNTQKARIYTVGLVGKNPDGTDNSFEATKLLQQIARESGGDFRLVSVGAEKTGAD